MRDFNYSEIDSELLVPEIMNLMSRIHGFKGKQEFCVKANPDNLKSMLKVARIQSAGASNQIEGISTSNARLKQLVLKETEPMNQDEEEIAGYIEVLDTINESYKDIHLTSDVILQLHRDLYSFHPSAQGGQFKNQNNIIEEVSESGTRQFRFIPLSAFETPKAVENLCSSYRKAVNDDRIDPLILISKFVLDFLSIHPFNDGNGRMSRLLTLLLLYQQGYIVGKYISIEMVIESTKESYYETLKESSIGWHNNENSYLQFVRYYLGVLLKAYRDFSERVEPVLIDKMSKSERVKDLFDKTLGKLSKLLFAKLFDGSVFILNDAEYLIFQGCLQNT